MMQISGETYWLDAFAKRGAWWAHGGQCTTQPHVVLTSGKHSNGFFNGGQVLEDALLAEKAAKELVLLLEDAGVDIGSIDRVVGPAMGAITLAHSVACAVALKRGRACLWTYAEKAKDEEGHPSFIFPRNPVRAGERVLIVEDTLTTWGSVLRVREAVASLDAVSLPYVLALLNRSGRHEMEGLRPIALVTRDMPVWDSSECPLCKVGSEALRPKGGENWAKLTAKA